MTSSDDIRRRVREAEEQRIERRAQAAASVASIHQEREQARQRLEELNRNLAGAVTDAERDMTRHELATFLGVRTRDVNEWAASSTRRTRSSSTKRSRTGSGTTQARTTSETAHPTTEDPAEHTSEDTEPTPEPRPADSVAPAADTATEARAPYADS